MVSFQVCVIVFDLLLKVKILELGNIFNDIRIMEWQLVINNGVFDFYVVVMKLGLVGQNVDLNGQIVKEDFFNVDIKDFGYLLNQVVFQQLCYELKCGFVIFVIMIIGIMFDLLGWIIVQVSQYIYDSVIGYFFFILQGIKLFGCYDSKVLFG